MTIPLYVQIKGKSTSSEPSSDQDPKFNIISDTNLDINDKTYEFDQIFTSETHHQLKSLINQEDTTSQCWLFMGPTNSGKTTNLYNVLIDKLRIINDTKSVCFMTAFEIIDNNKKYIIDLMAGDHNKVRSNQINFENQLIKDRFDTKLQLKNVFKNRLTKRTAFNVNSSRSVLIITLYYNNVRHTFIDFMGNEEFSTNSNVFANSNISSISQLILSGNNKSIIGRSSNFITNFIFKKHHHNHNNEKQSHNLNIILHLDLYGNEKLIKSTLNNMFQMIQKFNTIKEEEPLQQQDGQTTMVKKRKLPHYAQPTMSSQSPIRKKRALSKALPGQSPVKFAKAMTYEDLKKSFQSLKHEYQNLTTQVHAVNQLVQLGEQDQNGNGIELLKGNVSHLIELNNSQSIHYEELMAQYNQDSESHQLKINDYELSMKDLAQSITENEHQIDVLKSDVNDKLNSINGLKSEVDEKQQSIEQLKEESEDKVKMIDQLKLENNDSQKVINQLNQDVIDKQTSIEKLTSETNQHQIKIQQLNQETTVKQTQIEQLNKDNTDKQTQIDQLTVKLNEKRNLINQLKSDLSSKQDSINQLNQELKAKQSIITQFETDSNHNSSQVDQLNQINLDKQLEIDQLTHQNIILNQDVLNKQSIINEQINKNQQLNGENGNKDDLINQLNAQVTLKDELINQLNSQVSSLTNDKDGKIRELKQVIESKDGEILKLQQQVEQHQQKEQQEQAQQVPSYDVPLINSDNLMMSVFPSLKSNTTFDPTTEMFQDKENTPDVASSLEDLTPSPRLNSSPTKSASHKKKNHNHGNVLHNSSNYKSLVGKQFKKKSSTSNNSPHKKSSPTKSPKVSTNNFGTLVQSQF